MEIDLKKQTEHIVADITKQAQSRSFRAAKELRNSAMQILRNDPKRTGKVYRKPYTKKATYTASAPGEPPALRSGDLRRSWRPISASEKTNKTLTIRPAIRTELKYAPLLNDGTPGGLIAPRPFEEPIIEHAKPQIKAIFGEPFLK